MNAKEILSKCSMTKHENKDCRHRRSLRMESLPVEDAGLAFWEEFCARHGWPEMPTTANIHRYIEVFVNIKEEKINQRWGLSKYDEGYRSGHELFIKPVLRRKAQLLSTPNAAAKPVIAAHESPAPNRTSNGNIYADDTSLVSTPAVNSNNKRPLPELDTDGEDFAEHSSRASFTLSVPSKLFRSSYGKLAPPPATVVSPLRQETILRLPLHTRVKTESDSYDDSGSVGATLNAGEMGDEYPQFKAHEFNITLSQTSDAIETYRVSRNTNTVPLVLHEWRYGLDGHDAIQTLNNKFRGKWKCSEDKYIYETRLGVVKAYIQLVMKEGYSDTEAIELLEQERAGRSIATLYKDLKKAAPKTEKGMKPSVYGEDEPEYPKDLFHQTVRVPRPPPIEETGFPLPVRRINSIPNIWKEWEVGWNGAPSMRSLIGTHGAAWNERRYEKYENHFRYRNQLVRTIHEAVRQKAAPSYGDAIRVLEDLRGAMGLKALCESKKFKSLLKDEWRISTAVKEYWKCGTY